MGMKRFGCWIIVLLLSFLEMETALATSGSGIDLQYTYVNRIFAGISVNSKTVTCVGYGTSKSVDGTTKIRMTLQKRAIGSSRWSEVCTWTTTAKGLTTVNLEKDKTVANGYDYRVKVKCTISDSEGVILETATKYSSIVQVK